MKTGPKLRVSNADEVAERLPYLSRAAAERATEPGSAKVSLQRHKRLLARAQEMAANLKARP